MCTYFFCEFGQNSFNGLDARAGNEHTYVL